MRISNPKLFNGQQLVTKEQVINYLSGGSWQPSVAPSGIIVNVAADKVTYDTTSGVLENVLHVSGALDAINDALGNLSTLSDGNYISGDTVASDLRALDTKLNEVAGIAGTNAGNIQKNTEAIGDINDLVESGVFDNAQDLVTAAKEAMVAAKAAQAAADDIIDDTAVVQAGDHVTVTASEPVITEDGHKIVTYTVSVDESFNTDTITTVYAEDSSINVVDTDDSANYNYAIKVNISTAEGNSLHLESDGLYVPDLEAKNITLEASASEKEGIALVYTLKQGENTVGYINIPKDQFLQNAEFIAAATEADKTADNTVIVGDPYIKFTFNVNEIVDPDATSNTDETISTTTTKVVYVAVKSLVDTYTGGKGITVTADNKIEADIADGLKFTDDTDDAKIAVNVDGTTIKINSNNELEAVIPVIPVQSLTSPEKSLDITNNAGQWKLDISENAAGSGLSYVVTDGQGALHINVDPSKANDDIKDGTSLGKYLHFNDDTISLSGIGTIPSSATATTIVGYIEEMVQDVKDAALGIDAGENIYFTTNSEAETVINSYDVSGTSSGAITVTTTDAVLNGTTLISGGIHELKVNVDDKTIKINSDNELEAVIPDVEVEVSTVTARVVTMEEIPLTFNEKSTAVTGTDESIISPESWIATVENARVLNVYSQYTVEFPEIQYSYETNDANQSILVSTVKIDAATSETAPSGLSAVVLKYVDVVSGVTATATASVPDAGTTT